MIFNSEKYYPGTICKVILLLFLGTIFHDHMIAQELLGNSIDDDGDCNIDCDDLSFGVRSFQYHNGMDANYVIGQSDFYSNSSGTSPNNLDVPYDIALDPTSDKVFLSELGNHRVLRYESYDRFLFGDDPEIVIGQTNFTDNTSGTSATKFTNPTGIFVDEVGILWVCDWANNRVLRFDNASSIITGASANGVLGQANFSDFVAATTSTGMDNPVDVVVNSGNLWVADQGNGRILRYANASSKSNGASADGVLGSADFTSTSSLVNQSNLAIAGGLAIVCNALYASDEGSNRILRWNNPAALANGANANGILGQSNYTTSNANTSQNGLSMPRLLSVDKYNNLYVTDSDNNRIIVYNEVGSKTDGDNADLVIGQSDFTSSLSGLDENSFDTPRGVAILDDGINQSLAIADVYNNRVMVFATAEHVTDELTVLNSFLPGSDPSMAGGCNFSFTTQPSVGNITILDPVTGEFSYDPGGPCAVNSEVTITIEYNLTNISGCSFNGELKVVITDSGVMCVEDCTNGIDDDLDCLIDCEDEECGTKPTNFISGMDADFVVGQSDFTSNSSGLSINKFHRPFDIAKDPTSGKIFVCDQNNNRILRYENYQSFAIGVDPEMVLGQSDFNSNVSGTTENNFSNPGGITVDDSGILWVADRSNHRVLKFNNASSLITGASATGVFGQAIFTTSVHTLTSSGMFFPEEVLVESDGTLWVSDKSNRRVLRFDNAASKSNGAGADGVLGQPDFTSEDIALNNSNTTLPSGITLICNSLYVADQDNNRVLRWDNAKALLNGAPASVVLGQPDFNTNTVTSSQNSFIRPRLISSDANGNLYVSSDQSESVRVFFAANGKDSGANADVVLGQSNFTNTSSGVASNRFNGPRGMTMLDNGDKQILAVCDGYNNRVMIFGLDEITTDELSNNTGIMAGSSMIGGGVTYGILTQPSSGTIVLDNATTGAYTYIPAGACITNDIYNGSFTYSVTNGNGCSSSGTALVRVTDSESCVEDCYNGIDDDLNGLIDEYDPECDFDGDGVINRMDIDNDNDGITDALEGNIPGSACSTYASRILFLEDFGSGVRTSNDNVGLCYENGSNAICSSGYNPAFSSSVDPGEYTVVGLTDVANQGQYNWVSEDDITGVLGERMAVFNPQDFDELLYEVRVDGIVPNVGISLNYAAINLWQSGSGMPIPSIGLRIMDTTGVILMTNTTNIAEDELWRTYTLNYQQGNYSSLVIQLFNNSASLTGNDFALDNIRISQNLRDCDGDNIANIFDLDSDNDGIPDIIEQKGLDVDFNGITDNINGLGVLITDINTNGADDFYEGQSILDTDSDQVFDIIDLDSDNDGIFDVLEAGGSDSNFDGKIGASAFNDPNGNGLSSIVDVHDSGTPLAMRDSDSDGNPDDKELDSDNDGCNDVIEAGFPDGDANGYLGTGAIGSGLNVNSKGKVVP